MVTLNPTDLPLNAMPNQAQTSATNYTITGLNNNELYYFYVLAVDTSGNMSSDWSEAATATPKASAFFDKPQTPGELDLKIIHDSDYSFIIEWNFVAGTNRQTVILEADGHLFFTLS